MPLHCAVRLPPPCSGLTTAKEMPTFRKDNMVTLKAPEEKPKRAPALPSAKNPAHTYGMASTYRSAEVVRVHGPEEPPVKHLMQGAYYDEWLTKGLAAEATTSRDRPYIPPAPTKAALGHSYGAARHLAAQQPNTEELWKMSKFKSVGPKVTLYTGGAPLAWKGPQQAGGAAAAGGDEGYAEA